MRVALTIILEDDPQRSVVVLWETDVNNVLEGLARLKGELDQVILARLPLVVDASWTVVPVTDLPDNIYSDPNGTATPLPPLPVNTCAAKPDAPFTPETAPCPSAEIPF